MCVVDKESISMRQRAVNKESNSSRQGQAYTNWFRNVSSKASYVHAAQQSQFHVQAIILNSIGDFCYIIISDT
ncbi:uncharacterized protein LOC122538365 isoform X2 [Frieseomelitta varia]|uniref:uncharacterized protein LOC122538365 isoform X2 n=1 Tax=Frieseomelitta varia TaxID=561572 RepID=UPI001CB6A1D3|nr:uncharacterized protein LOC122538365 isoform X2 [Frieseomelitta varia]